MNDYSQRNNVERQWLHKAAAVLLIVVGLAGWVTWLVGPVRMVSVPTAAMEPGLHAGDAVLVRLASEDDLKPGDIISYHSPADGRIALTSRVAGYNEDGQVVTQADAAPGNTDVLDPGLLIGRVERQLPNVGYVVDFMRSRLGLVLLVYVPAMLIVSRELRRLTIYFRPTYRHWSVIAIR